MVSDAQVRTGTRLLTLAAFLTFIAWVAFLHPAALLGALLLAGGAYALFLFDRRRRHVAEALGAGRDVDDRIMEGSEVAVSPGVSAGGIHLTFETRSRWRRRGR